MIQNCTNLTDYVCFRADYDFAGCHICPGSERQFVLFPRTAWIGCDWVCGVKWGYHLRSSWLVKSFGSDLLFFLIVHPDLTCYYASSSFQNERALLRSKRNKLGIISFVPISSQLMLRMQHLGLWINDSLLVVLVQVCNAAYLIFVKVKNDKFSADQHTLKMTL